MSATPTVLLVSQDAALTEAVREALSVTPGRFPLEVADSAEEVDAETLGEVGLLLVHLDDGDGLEPVGRLLWWSSTMRRPIPVLTLGDAFDADRDLALFRMGVADALSRAHHLERLGALIAALCLRRPNHIDAFEPAEAEPALPLRLPIVFSAS
jgi:DNA-binding response OmpR family regulator